MKKELILCIDIGGTHITSAVVDRDAMQLVDRSFCYQPVNSQGSRQAILADWDQAIQQSLASINKPLDAMMIAIPGPFDYTQGICLMDGMHKYQSLLHLDVKSYLAVTYGIPKSAIFFFNDAQAFLLGEIYHQHWFAKRVVGLTLGTGLGSAWYDQRELKDLNYGSASFREGIAEDYISTRGLLGFLAGKSNRSYANVKELVEDEAAAAEQKLAFDFLREALLEFIQAYILPLDPDAIVIGGSIAKAERFFLAQLQAEVPIPIQLASMDEKNIFYGMAASLPNS